MKINKTKTPNHIAVIPDGNRRWSKKNGISLPRGYAQGAEQIERVMEAAFENGVKYFTAWAASNDNLKKRTAVEIKILKEILRKKLRDFLSSKEIERKRMRVRIIGAGIDELKDAEIKKLKDTIEKKTAVFTAHHFTLLFGYDGKTEMLAAIEKIKKNTARTTYESVKENLMTAELPPVDLVIRTGGEPHWSAGFMMWHTTDSEFYFTETFWPSFHEKELQKALKDYATRRSLKGK